MSTAVRTCEDASEAALVRAEAQLSELAEASTDSDLAVLAAHQEAGDTPLLGTSFRTHVYPALMWNGERFERLRAAWPARLAFLAGVTASKASDRHRLSRAVELGETVRRLWPEQPAGPRAGLTTDSVGAAVCAAVAEGISDHELEQVAEMAAALMLVTPANPTAEIRESHAGHALASGWLAVQLFRSGVLAVPGTAAEVLMTLEAP